LIGLEGIIGESELSSVRFWDCIVPEAGRRENHWKRKQKGKNKQKGQKEPKGFITLLPFLLFFALFASSSNELVRSAQLLLPMAWMKSSSAEAPARFW
jgi:hypothetical protein